MTTNEDLLFVELALKRELVTQEVVDEILAMQKQLGEMGLKETVADLLVKRGALSAKDAEAIRIKVSPKGGRQQITGYRLIERLGRGGMGAVYKATQLSMGRKVAIKVLKPSLAKDDSRIERLKREAQLVGQLRHENIVQGLDVGVSHGFHYFAMEFVDGPSLKEVLESRGAMKEGEALRIVKEVAQALEYAHQEGVVHRDVKPGNILIAKDGSVKLADYGLAKGPLEDVELTHSGVTMGTPQYISPEQARGPSDVDIRTDIYSLGATLYHLVTGRPPYQGETLAHMIQQVLYEPYAPPRSLRRDLSQDIAFLIEKMMARKPGHRYQSPKELLKDLEAIEKERSIVPAGWQGDFEAFHLRRRFRRLVAATVALLVLTAGLSVNFTLKAAAEARKQRELTASTTLARLQDTQPLPEAFDSRIREIEDFREEYSDTAAAATAQEMIAGIRRQQANHKHHLNAMQEARGHESKLEFRLAIKLMKEAVEDLRAKGEDGGPCLSESLVELQGIRGRRDDRVKREFQEELDKQRNSSADPEMARTALSATLQLLQARSYLPEEEQRALGEPARLVGMLERAISGTERYLGAVRKSIQSLDPAKDYNLLTKQLDAAKAGFLANDEVQLALAGIDSIWRADLERRFPRLGQQILTQNRAEGNKVLGFAETLMGEGRLEEAIAKLGEIVDRSLPEVADPLFEEREKLEGELEKRRTELDEAWATFLPEYLDRLGKREWSASQALVAKLLEDATRFVPNDYMEGRVPATQQLLDVCRMVETRFRSEVSRLGHLPDGLRFGSTRYTPVSGVRIEGESLRFAMGGIEHVKPIRDVAVEDLFGYSGLKDEPGIVKTAYGILEFGELKKSNPRVLRDALPTIKGKVLQGRAEPMLTALVDSIAAMLERERANADAAIARTEKVAEDLFDLGMSEFNRRQWQSAYGMFTSLLEDPVYRDTDFVRANRLRIQDWQKQAKTKLPTAKVGEYFRTRADHLAGNAVNRGNYEVSLFFDLEEPEELDRFDFTEGRIGIVEVKKIVLGPAATPEEAAVQHTVREHLLSFLPAGEEPAEWLRRHPLRLEAPFLRSQEMTIEFKARWDRPLAFLISLCGTNVVVLTDDGRPENGRGVHIWQSADLGRPDLAVPGELRKTWITKHPEVLEGDGASRKYFQFEKDRWYRVRFVKGQKFAALYVDDRLILERGIEQYAAKSREIAIITYSSCQLDDLRIQGTLDPEWFHRRVK